MSARAADLLVLTTESLLFSCWLWSKVVFALRNTRAHHTRSHSAHTVEVSWSAGSPSYCSYCHLLRRRAPKFSSHFHSSPAKKINARGREVLFNWMKVKWFFQHTFWSFSQCLKGKIEWDLQVIQSMRSLCRQILWQKKKKKKWRWTKCKKSQTEGKTGTLLLLCLECVCNRTILHRAWIDFKKPTVISAEISRTEM